MTAALSHEPAGETTFVPMLRVARPSRYFLWLVM